MAALEPGHESGPSGPIAVPTAGPITHHLAPGADFLGLCAARILAACQARLPDLSGIVVAVPNLLLAPELRTAIAFAAGRPLLLPGIVTLFGWADPLLDASACDTPARRQIRLFSVLRDWRMLEGNSRWQIADALIALFDELTAARVELPPGEQALAERLSAGYGTGIAEPLSFEARLVHALWLADRDGAPSLPAARSLALGELAQRAQAPLFVVCDGEPLPDQRAFFDTYARRAPVELFVPDRRLAGGRVDSPLAVLNAAWPPDPVEAPLIERAAGLRDAASPSLAGRVELVAADSLEALARHTALQVRAWLAEGRTTIALIAADRVAARRARALLERDDILVADETGWKLATTRAAALVDAWHEVIAGDGYHRSLLDLLKSPFLAAGLDPAQRAAAIDGIELHLARRNIAAGLDVLAASLEAEMDRPHLSAARRLMRGILAARDAFARTSAEPARWIARLLAVFDALDARAALAGDAAGADLLDLLGSRAAELEGNGRRLDFGEWREWLDRQLEAATFRDSSIDSPVVMTHLAAARLRHFDAAIVIGADRQHLAPGEPAALLSHDAVRRELGLPGSEAALARLRDDLSLLIANSDRMCIAWQAMQADEHCLPAVEIELLALVQRAAFGDDLHRVALAGSPPGADPTLAPQRRPAPALTPAEVPHRVSASGYQSLVDCPYQYFSRQVLGLGEREEVSEALEKRDYGERVHAILAGFHQRYPVVMDHDDAPLLADLEAYSRAAFAAEIERNALELGWLERWLRRLPAYLAWQREREAAGWRFSLAEQRCEMSFELADGAPLRLEGRLDRIDANDAGARAVLDYKTQPAAALAARLKAAGEDVQLAVYTILQGEAVTQAAYVALDDEVKSRELAEPQAAAADQYQRLVDAFSAMRSGAPLPAHGAPWVCRHCAARGLCRRDWFA